MLKNMVVINVLKSCSTSQQCPVAISNKVQRKSIWKDVDYIIPLIGNPEGCNLEEEALLRTMTAKTILVMSHDK